MGYALRARGCWKGDLLAADVGELQENGASEVYLRTKKTRVVLVPKEGDNFTFPFADGSAMLAGKGFEVRTSNRIREDI